MSWDYVEWLRGACALAVILKGERDMEVMITLVSEQTMNNLSDGTQGYVERAFSQAGSPLHNSEPDTIFCL